MQGNTLINNVHVPCCKNENLLMKLKFYFPLDIKTVGSTEVIPRQPFGTRLKQT